MNRSCCVVMVCLLLLAWCCASAAGEQTPPAKTAAARGRVVEAFMSLMVERQLAAATTKGKLADIDQKMLAMLAPYYFEVIGVDKNRVTINKYSPDGFRVVWETGDYVGVKLLRKTNPGPTLIVFKTAAASGGVFIEPATIKLAGNSDPSFVTPWFYAAEQNVNEDERPRLPEIGRPTIAPLLPATREVAGKDGVGLVNQLIRYLAGRNKLSADERRAAFRSDILPNLARGYTDIYGIDLGFYEDVAMDDVKNCKIAEGVDAYVVMSCVDCLYERYYFKIVMEEGRPKIMPTGVDNYRKTISPVWLRE